MRAGLAVFIFVASAIAGCQPTNTDSDSGFDASIALCGLSAAGFGGGCAAADVGLSAEICRCGSKYYWNGTACTATAACSCNRNCDQLFDTQVACETAYAACFGDAARD